MKISHGCLMLAGLACLLVARPAAPAESGSRGGAAPAAAGWQQSCARLKTYTQGQGNDADLRALEQFFPRAKADEWAQIESTLVGLLRDPQVSVEAKQFICRQGAYLRSDQAVEALAELQAHPQFSFLACYALQRMPNAHVTATLRGLLGKRVGRQRVDLIRTFGALRDRQAVGLLAAELKSADAKIGRAALVALQTTGGPQAEQALAAYEPLAPAALRPAVAEARLGCASALPAQRAAEIYRQYLHAAWPAARMVAMRGMLDLRPEERTSLLLDAIRGNDPALKSVALRQARSGGGADLSARLSAALDSLSPADQAAVLDVLGDRGQPGALPAVLKLAGSPQRNVRTAALSALGHLGDSRQVDLLIQAASQEQDDARAVVRNALAILRGKGVNERLMELAVSASADARTESIAALAARDATAAVPLLLRALDAPEPKIQLAALAALRTLAGTRDYPELLRRTLAAHPGAIGQRLQEVLVAVYRRSTTPQQCVAQLIAALPAATPAGRSSLLLILGALGDPQGLEVLLHTLQSSDVEQRKTALRALANWPDSAPVEQLMSLVQAGQEPVVAVLAVRTLVTLVSRDRTMSAPQKAKLLGELLERATRREEKRLVLGALPKAACARSLQWAVGLLGDADLADEAAAAVAGIGAIQQRAGISRAEMLAALEKAERVAKVPVVQNQLRAQLKALRSEPRP